MNNEQYKIKYQELKLKFVNIADTAWRLGYEAGLQGAQLQNSQQQVEQANQNAQLHAQTASATNQKVGQPEEKENPESENNPSEHPDGSELDQHISELEGMLGKSEFTPSDLKKVISSMKLAQITKNEIKPINISHLPINLPNMDNNSKESINIQNNIVKGVMAKWADEEKRASKDILSTLNAEGLTRKE